MAEGSPGRRRRGRPVLPPEKGKRHSVGIRTTKKVKDLLQQAADSAGRSLAQEIEFRLERSFDRDEALAQAQKLAYGPAAAVALAIIGRASVEIGRLAGFPKSWIDRKDLTANVAWAASATFSCLAGESIDNPPNGLIVAPMIVWRLLGAVQAPEHVVKPELRQWAAPLNTMLGTELASQIKVPTWVEWIDGDADGIYFHRAMEQPQ